MYIYYIYIYMLYIFHIRIDTYIMDQLTHAQVFQLLHQVCVCVCIACVLYVSLWVSCCINLFGHLLTLSQDANHP